MINVLNVKITTTHFLLNREVYITLRSKEATHASRVVKINSEVCEWNLEEDCIVLDREQCNSAVVLELWDYNLRVRLGKHSIVKLKMDEVKRSVYNGFFIGLAEDEVRLTITYQSLAEGITEKVKGKETKRTESTNRQSNNSLTNIIEQTGSSNHLYKSLIHSLSERNMPQYKSSQPQSKLYKFSPKNSQLLAKYNRQIL